MLRDNFLDDPLFDTGVKYYTAVTYSVESTLVMVEHTGHSMLPPGQQPTSDAVVALVADFFSRTLIGS
jgi:hypothetical protein